MKTPNQKISALVITYNEIGYIEKCINSISFADEIIVVDSYSTDGTFEYLKEHKKVKVIQHPFKNFTTQKNFALKQANFEWVLFVDADEVVTKKLEREIITTVNSTSPCAAYWFYRKFMFKNKRLHFSGWQTDKNHRLFQKSKVHYANEKLVHETLVVNGTSGKLKARLTHYCYKNFEDYKSKMLHYGSLKAKEIRNNGGRFTYGKLIFKPLWKFTYNFIFRLGFLDFDKGMKICYLNALSVYQRYAILKMLKKNQTKVIYSNLNTNSELAKAS